MEDFKPEYPGDNENREWVRKKHEEKGFSLDPRTIILRLPKRSIDILFLALMKREMPSYG